MTIYKGMPTNQLGADQVHADSGFTRAELEGLAKNHSTPAGREAAQRALAELNGPAPAARSVKPTPAARTVAPAAAAKVAPPVKAKTFDSIREAAYANLAGESQEPKAEEPEVKTNAYGFPVSAEATAAGKKKKTEEPVNAYGFPLPTE